MNSVKTHYTPESHYFWMQPLENPLLPLGKLFRWLELWLCPINPEEIQQAEGSISSALTSFFTQRIENDQNRVPAAESPERLRTGSGR
ncbi:MAG TPA: hypothetical protein VNZ47_16710 [Candidatus Dormibacteraeota bacterium]|jgi:hypothetical protein|nr:hypothetical protein [Candidatus Dormibacteraeota bacterium]